jgi:hypothetical protein
MNIGEIMSNKKYSATLKDKYDGISKKITNDILFDVAKAKLVTNNVKEDSGDFSEGFWDQKYQLPKGDIIIVESEMKDKKWWGSHWGSSPFKYDTMDIPFRKSKNKANLFVVISTCESYAWLVNREVVEKHLQESGGKPKNKKTIYEPDGGDYYSTPTNKGLFVCNINGKWKRW